MMEYTLLGNTGVQVSRICLGCMSYGAPGWHAAPWVLDEESAGPFFRSAIENGINFFDTADSYSVGRSEEITGRWLKEYASRDEVVIATKVFFGPADRPNRRGLSRKHIQQACEASLKRLGVDCIDLYQIHRLDPNTPIDETLAALDQLIQQGKVRYIGACSMYAWELMKALSISDRGGLAKFVSMQNLYNLLYREEEREMLALCEAENIAIIPWSPLARGVLAGKYNSDDRQTKRNEIEPKNVRWFHDDPSVQQIVDIVITMAERRGVKPAQVSLAWLLSKDVITAPIVGATKQSHISDAVDSLSINLDDEEIKALEAVYIPKPTFGITPPYAMPSPGTLHDRG